MEWTIGWWQISIQRVIPSREQLIQMYDRAAFKWHSRLQWSGYHRSYIAFWRSLQQSGLLARLHNNSHVCDCGIGTAAFSLALAKTVSFPLQFTGVDISSEMLQKTHQNLSLAKVKHQLYQSDVNHLPFEDNTFDLVMSAHMLEHLPNAATGLKEMVRVLRPGEPLVLVVTRPGLLGWYIQWHWGNRCIGSRTLVEMMQEAQLTNIQLYPFSGSLSRWMSIACVGFKA